MKQFLLLIFSVIFCSLTTFSQKSLSDYAYVLIPQQFEFQSSKDQFRLNTLVRHLFKSNGFNALYDEELGSLPRCEGVFANVIQEKAFLKTKVVIVINDCHNNEIYRSQVGESKEKDHSISYPEAIRNAFTSIQHLNIKQKDLEELRTKSEVTQVSTTANEVKTQVIEKQHIETSNLAVYQFNNELYFLEKNNADYVLYKNYDGTSKALKIGDLKASSRAGMYVFESNGESHLANFDESKNLIIDGKDATGKSIQNVYVLKEE